MAERMRALVVDDARKAGVDLGPAVDQTQLDQDFAYVKIGKDEGAKLKLGGERLNRATPGHYMAPALFVDADNAMRIAREEIFGPVAAMIPARDYEHALAIANDTEFGLCGGIVTTSLKYAQHFKRNAEVGMAMVNLATAGVDFHAPFGDARRRALAPASRAAMRSNSTRRSRPPIRRRDAGAVTKLTVEAAVSTFPLRCCKAKGDADGEGLDIGG